MRIGRRYIRQGPAPTPPGRVTIGACPSHRSLARPSGIRSRGKPLGLRTALLPLISLAAFRQRRRALLLGVLLALVLALGAVLSLGARYLLVGPGTEASILPPLTLPGQQSVPRFLFSINGVGRPLGVAVSPAGDRIYVTESDGERQLKIFDRDGNLLRAVAPPETGVADRAPVYVAVHPNGKVYVSDRRRSAVDIYSSAGDHEGTLELPAEIGRPWAPLALAFSPGGDLALSDLTEGQHSVLIIGPDGALRLAVGETQELGMPLSYPNAVAFDRRGHLFVSDSNNGRVLALDATGQLLFAFTGGSTGRFALPRGLAVAGDLLYVADATGHQIFGFALGERGVRHIFSFGGGGHDNGRFAFPNGLAVDALGRLYATDRENHRVQVWTN